MLMFAVFGLLSFIGIIFFIYGFYQELYVFSIINPALGLQGFLPQSLMFFILGMVFPLIAVFGMMYRVKSSGCSKRFDKVPKDKRVMEYIYQDGNVTDVIANRRMGMGIFEIPNYGIIVDVGRLPTPGSVYTFGDKKINYALQNLYFTPNPKFTSIYTFYTEIGINNGDELYNLLNGLDAELLVKVWNKLCRINLTSSIDNIVEYAKNITPEERKIMNKEWKKTVSNDRLREMKKIERQKSRDNRYRDKPNKYVVEDEPIDDIIFRKKG